MNSLVLLVTAIILFLVAYTTYGGYLAKKWGIDGKRPTPAHTLRDDVDYIPCNNKVILGHHFSSIAGAGPITGPILAAVFGWIPVFLWIVIGSIFFGGVHDYGSLFASIRHGGKSIGEIIRENVGEKAKIIFNIFAWLALILVVAAFTDICASTFAYNANDLTGAQAGTSSILFIFLAMAFGFLVYRKNTKLSIATIVGVLVLIFCIWLGYVCPFIKLTKVQWQIVLLIYITLASILPVWMLLQPRDYLCSFLLYAMLIGALLGIIFKHPNIQIPAFAGFKVGNQSLFPFLFITVACGAISGFHSLVSSGTTAKQIDKEEPDIKLVGYGSMLIEGLVAVVALIAVGYVSKAEGTPANIFASGVSNFMNSFGIPLNVGKVFVILSFSAFALTSLDTATRIARYVLQELFEKKLPNGEVKKSPLTNMYVATFITVLAALGLILFGYQKIWPIFGASNQLLAALALLALTAWFTKQGKRTLSTIIPMCFMFIITLSALTLIIKNNLCATNPNYVLAGIGTLLFILAIALVIQTLIVFKNRKKA